MSVHFVLKLIVFVMMRISFDPQRQSQIFAKFTKAKDHQELGKAAGRVFALIMFVIFVCYFVLKMFVMMETQVMFDFYV